MQQLPQIAALPVLALKGEPHVLLITSRDTGRWIIPKGWTAAKHGPADMAAREAREEAGVAGHIDPTPIGVYTYIKRLHTLAWVRCNVTVFLLHVDRQYAKWPERFVRQQVWLPAGIAAEKVRERDLAALIQAYGNGAHSYPVSGA